MDQHPSSLQLTDNGEPGPISQRGLPTSTATASLTEIDLKFCNLKNEIYALYVEGNKTLSSTMQIIQEKYGRVAW